MPVGSDTVNGLAWIQQGGRDTDVLKSSLHVQLPRAAEISSFFYRRCEVELRRVRAVLIEACRFINEAQAAAESGNFSWKDVLFRSSARLKVLYDDGRKSWTHKSGVGEST